MKWWLEQGKPGFIAASRNCQQASGSRDSRRFRESHGPVHVIHSHRFDLIHLWMKSGRPVGRIAAGQALAAAASLT